MASFAEIPKSTIVTLYNSDNSIFRGDPQQTDEEEILKIEYRRFVRNKIIYECLSDCVDDLDPEMGNKLESIIMAVKLKQYLKLENQSLLGISSNIGELSYQESEALKSTLQKKLLEKKTKVSEEFRHITSKDLDQIVKTPNPSALLHGISSSQEQLVLSYKEKLVKVRKSFMTNVIRRNQILEEMLDLRLNKVPEKCNQTNRYCKSMIESNYLKAKIAEYKMKLDIFMEVPKAIEAYHQLLKDIKKQQEECEFSIEKMKELKRKYETVGGREYDEILKSYLMYKCCIDKFHKMYDLVK